MDTTITGLKEGDTVEYRVGINYLRGKVVTFRIAVIDVEMEIVTGPTFTRQYHEGQTHPVDKLKLRKAD